jgi:REP element-mobilizing transposase RayT
VARPPRLLVANGIYHVAARGNERAAIVRSDTDRRAFEEILGSTPERYGWRILSYCLMNNHYHLLVQTPVPNIAEGMRHLNGVYAQWFNRRYTRVGHLFQGRYGATLVQADGHLLAAARYIVRNPVVAGLCRDPADWPWSSHRTTLGLERRPFVSARALLAYFSVDPTTARERYRAYIHEVDEAVSSHPLVCGDDDFVAGTLRLVRPTRGVPARYLRPPPPAIETLFAGADPDRALLRAAESGYSTREIARHLGVNASTVSRRLRRHARSVGATEET